MVLAKHALRPQIPLFNIFVKNMFHSLSHYVYLRPKEGLSAGMCQLPPPTGLLWTLRAECCLRTSPGKNSYLDLPPYGGCVPLAGWLKLRWCLSRDEPEPKLRQQSFAIFHHPLSPLRCLYHPWYYPSKCQKSDPK